MKINLIKTLLTDTCMVIINSYSKSLHLLQLAILLLISTLCFSQKLDCKKFKNGEFYYPDLPDKITIRKDSIQGSYSSGNLEIMWDVIWKNDCEYDIVCSKIFNKDIPLEIGDRIAVKIVSTKKKCYYSELTVFNSSFPDGMTLPDDPFPLCFNENKSSK